jgi:tRNA threonylcarbamoyladenosine biosynthesis protein TsaE
MKEKILKTESLQETHELGALLGAHAEANMVFLLDGDLGAGKTTLTQGIAKGLGVARNITSPTFNILKIYHGG